MNRVVKPTSLVKKKPQNIQLSPVVLKCYGIVSAISLKNNRQRTQARTCEKKPVPVMIDQSTKQQEQIEIEAEASEQDINRNLLKLQIPKFNQELIKKNTVSRNRKKSSLSNQKLYVKSKNCQNNKLILFYRNQIISLFSLLGKRQQYLNSLRGNKIGNNNQSAQNKSTNISNPPLKSNQIQQRLTKELNLKGKDKGRKNFSHLTNEQLRSIKYKPRAPPALTKKQSKNKDQQKQQDNQQEIPQGEQQDELKKYPDMATWKRKNGVGYNQKVFIIKGGYQSLRKALVSKGWAQNEQVRSSFFDLKWTTKISDINYSELKNGQFVNHFNNNHHLTSKYGLTRRLRSLTISYNVDIDKFYPRCFDLGDQNEFQNFVQNFKFCFAGAIAKRFIVQYPKMEHEQKYRQKYKNKQLKLRTLLKILKKMNLSFLQRINKINNGQFPVIQTQEWEIITETDEYPEDVKLQKLKQLKDRDDNVYLQPLSKTQRLNRQQQKLNMDPYLQQLHKRMQKQLNKQAQMDPQHQMSGYRNVWIAKPNFLSRGRGIKCFNNLYNIADYCLGRDVQFVIQKYIEKPLLIQGKKFDIRQWVLIQDYCPPKIYFYQECYLRFCMDDYSLDNIHNRFMHLTNNSVQKHNKKAKIEESMWQISKFAEYIGAQKWNLIKQKIKNIVVWSIKSCENYVTSKKGSFQLVGFDFMIDQRLNPWLIEINMSPSMDSSTPVTKKLVKMLLHDTGILIASSKQKRQMGNYTCIYQQESDLSNFPQYVLK